MRRALLAFEPPDGGVAENVAQLALGLSAHGWEPSVVGPPESNVYERLESAGVAVNRIPFERGIGGPFGEIRALRALGGLLDAGRFELVHAHSSKAGALTRLAARRRVPTVYSPHCFAFVGEIPRPQRAFAIATERLLGRWTDAIVCVCDDERRRALEARVAPPDRLYRVDYGVESCPGGEVSEQLAAMRAEGPVVGAVAVLRRQKRLELLIEAAPTILRGDPSAHVAIVGNGPEQSDLEGRAAALGLDREPRFRMIPFEGTSWKYLKGLDVFVLPSAWEALPIGLLEALSCGVPQVATAVAGIPEAVRDGETGVLVEPRAERVAAATLDLLRDSGLRAKMAEASRRRQAERFTVDRMVSDTAAVYDAVANA